MASDLEGASGEASRANAVLRDFTMRQDKQEYGVFELDEDGVIRKWSEGAYLVFGFSAEEALGNPLSMLYTAEDRNAGLPTRDLNDARRGGRTHAKRWAYRKDGSVACTDASIFALKDANHRTVGFSNMVREIPGGDDVRQELQQRLDQQVVIADLGLRALGAEDVSALMTAASAAIARTLRVDRASVLEARPSDLLLRGGFGWPDEWINTAKIADSTSSHAGHVLHTCQPLIIEDVRREDRFPGETFLGESHPVSVIAIPIPGEVRPWGVLTAHSFSPRRFTKGDTGFMESAANLLALALQRWHVEASLRKQAEELSRSNAELQQFAYVASHDLQEPLRTVASFVQMLARRYNDKLDQEGREYIAFAVEGVQRMSNLVRDLLTYSRVVSAEGKAARDADLNGLMAWGLANLKPRLDEAGATVTHDKLPTAAVDGMQLSQVFEELIGNALKFRSEEPPRVHVAAEDLGEEWKISVRDNGIGFDPQYSSRIFSAFKRLHGRQYSGTGIGLAICRTIVERHGGRIWADSEPGHGSTFHFTLPK